MYQLPSLDAVRRDLAVHQFSLAYLLEACVRPGSASHLLGLPGQAGVPQLDDMDLMGSVAFSDIDSVYRYATFAENDRGPGGHQLDLEDDPLGRLAAFAELFSTGSQLMEYMEELADAHGFGTNPYEGFIATVRLAVARSKLDAGLPMTLSEVALLAQMSERSVSNALSADGDARLIGAKSSSGAVTVEANDAARWLDGRRGFLKTVQMRSLKDLPEEPTADEFKRILVARIQDMVPDTRLIPSSITAGQGLQYEVGMRASTLAQALGWPVERARPWVAGEVGALDPEDCNGIAKATGLDAGWLTLQVVRVRFPEAARHLQPTPELVRSTGTFAAGPMSIDVTLTEAGIRNGYFDIEQRQARRFFPDDAFGGRGSDETGRDIVLHVDGRTESTDIRVKSKALVSPRRRFSAYFKSQKAVPGDVIRITRTGDRAYQVTFIGK